MDALTLSKKVPNRKTLYQKLQRLYDLPKYSPFISVKYLKRVLQGDQTMLRVKRDETFHVPKEEVKRFRSEELFLLLEKTLIE